MKIAVLGTGMVGRTHAGKLSQLGYEVVVGTRVVIATKLKDKPDMMGNPPFSAWLKDNKKVKLENYSDAAKQGEIIINAVKGEVVVETLKSLEQELSGKILIDISNPLDFSKGMPPTLFVSNIDSLGEQIQKVLPRTKVVKTLNTLNAYLQVDPNQLANGDHDIFISGNDAEAKAKVVGYLKEWYGWKRVIDLGDITTARGAEMVLPLWLRLFSTLKKPMFNIKVVTE
ncbi:NADP oxidoreductase [Candidatus Roizmanbacteria bacterium RIFCSPHIGHO2_01_FULL_35_10]|uniref:NADP oxidoreductase n=1 Tax=Candidatus Roizmanbacteria bacterium RIFCSPLOWO2_01_FULL_35_13 TaxID=1802055 RepID=A0A1F7I6Y7_9BACT|nr:MAG: NADP oxidoreductase [Candidatus Roizmanbacteria bacterium RIFCSPHIGHO2_01_FULL_35_10]OGK39124.1 MAG: NADP oxidoreductase [Candidatus Roizmanbacteria bacterium RIFCSPLOWO2_01_FULL_35_13]